LAEKKQGAETKAILFPMSDHWSRARWNVAKWVHIPAVLHAMVIDYLKPIAFPRIDEVAATLTDLGIDNVARKRHITLAHLRDHKHITDATPESDILEVVRAELTAFIAIMRGRVFSPARGL
jgi:hypothetical protein